MDFYREIKRKEDKTPIEYEYIKLMTAMITISEINIQHKKELRNESLTSQLDKVIKDVFDNCL